MSKQVQSSVAWGDHTVIEKKKLENYIFELDRSSDTHLELSNYEIEVDAHGMRKRAEFLNFLKDQTPNFIFSESKQEEILKNDGWPYDKARRKIGDISNKSDGFYSELLLYLIMEGFLDFPLVSHKMAVKEDYNTQVKGTDGLYIGTHNGDDVVGYGEAKFYQNKSNALTDAIDGVSEYHGIDGLNEREAEIDVARENISDDLETEQIEDILDEVLSMSRNLPIIHPILIAYEAGDYDKLKSQCESREEALEIIWEFHEREKFLKLVSDRVEDTPDLHGIQMLVFFLRVDDTNRFKQDLESLI